MSMLCKLSDLKTLLGIPQEVTSQDDKLTLMIKSASAKIEGYIGYSLARADYVDELHSVNNRQLIELNHFQLQSVQNVTVNGEEITDYKILSEYARWGRLYRGNGWSGGYYTRGFTHDVVAGVWNIKVTYIAGYYFPGDTGYVEGAEDSLHYDIITCCLNSVVEKYNFEAMGAKGLKAHTEGHISDTYADSANDIGLSESAKKVLSKYVYYGIA
jgi:hypothetical protein